MVSSIQWSAPKAVLLKDLQFFDTNKHAHTHTHTHTHTYAQNQAGYARMHTHARPHSLTLLCCLWQSFCCFSNTLLSSINLETSCVVHTQRVTERRSNTAQLLSPLLMLVVSQSLHKYNGREGNSAPFEGTWVQSVCATICIGDTKSAR